MKIMFFNGYFILFRIFVFFALSYVKNLVECKETDGFSSFFQ